MLKPFYMRPILRTRRQFFGCTGQRWLGEDFFLGSKRLDRGETWVTQAW